jgi:anti-sigma factor (TIGR02949 family)
MSCGDRHELDCSQALDHLDEFLDGEVGPADHALIARHLQECGHCHKEYDVECIVKSIVARSCCQVAPATLRDRLVAELARVRIQTRSTDGS